MSIPNDVAPVSWLEHVTEAVRSEVLTADEKYGPPASAHESYGVLAEEVVELLEAIRGNNPVDIHREAVQVAAVAIRLAVECAAAHELDGATAFGERSFGWARR